MSEVWCGSRSGSEGCESRNGGVRYRCRGRGSSPSSPSGGAGNLWTTEQGSIVPLLAIIVFVVMMVLLSIAATAEYSARAARAQWAADSAALAIASVGLDDTGVAAGRAVAEANGADLVAVSAADSLSGSGLGPSPSRQPPEARSSMSPMSTVVVVKVERRGFSASAAAARFFEDRG